MRATHKGQCQCCGAVQKLPNGVLSQHGYRVLWNSFSGICAGASYPPYEVSCNLIASFIVSAKGQKAHYEKFQAELRQPATEAKGWWHEYISGGWTAKSRYAWNLVEIRVRPGHIRTLQFKNHEGVWDRFDMYDYSWKTLLDVATIMNKARADALNSDIAALERYIAWQTQRVTDWKLTPLTAMEDS